MVVDAAKNGVVRLNIGSGLCVAPGWIHLDASLNAFFAGSPRWLLRYVYAISGAKAHYSLEQFGQILSGFDFVHHGLEYGLPFETTSVDFVYSSHLIEHLFLEDAKKLAKNAFEILKKGGIIRIAAPDLAFAIALYEKGEKNRALGYFFSENREGYLARHQYMYDFDLMKNLLEGAGFRDVRRCAFRQGETPNIDILDNRPEETLFVEARK
jgi:SAM-dependent methyltransferase